MASPVSRPAASGVDIVPEPAHERWGWHAGLSGRMAARALGLLSLAATVVMLAVVDYPSLLGRWEDFGSFPIMLGPAPRLSFEIMPGGFIYNYDRSRYGLVDLGYYTAEWLGWSLTAFRLPALVAGAASVAVFFVVAARAFGFWPGLVGALALALNPMFLVFWHQQIVSMITMLFLLLVIERCQYLECSGHRPGALLWGVPTLAPAFALLLLHYGPGRAYGGALVAWWAGSIAWRIVRDRRAGRPVERTLLLAVPACALLVAGCLMLLDPRNGQYVLAPWQLLASPQSEVVQSADQLTWIGTNVLIVLTAVVPPLNLVPGRFAEVSTDLLADYRYHLLPTVLVPVCLLGLGVVVGQVSRSAQARLLLLLLLVTLGGPLLSQGASISAVRMLYGVIPLSLGVAAGAGWLLAVRHVALRSGAVGLLAALVLLQASAAWTEIRRHRSFVDDLADRWSPSLSLRAIAPPVDRWVNPDDELLSNGSYRYYLEQGGLPALAAARRLLARAPGPAHPNEVVLVQLDGPIQRNDPTGPVKLVFFLRELGVSAALFDPATQRLRGAGSERPAYVIAASNAGGSGARRQLEAAGLTVRLREYKP